MSLNSFDVILAQTAPTTASTSTGTATGAPPPAGAPPYMQLLIIVPMFIVLYMLMIRPQSKKAKEHAALVSTLKAGDKVVTSGGLVGTVVSVKDKTVSLRSADTKLEVLKSSVSEVTERSGESNAGES